MAKKTHDIRGDWQRLFAMGERYAKKKGIKPEDVQCAIDKRRGDFK